MYKKNKSKIIGYVLIGKLHEIKEEKILKLTNWIGLHDHPPKLITTKTKSGRTVNKPRRFKDEPSSKKRKTLGTLDPSIDLNLIPTTSTSHPISTPVHNITHTPTLNESTESIEIPKDDSNIQTTINYDTKIIINIPELTSTDGKSSIINIKYEASFINIFIF